MSTITAQPVEVKTVLTDPLADAERFVSEMSVKVDDLVARMKLALDTIAELAGAWHCDNCGEYTTETVTAHGWSEELGDEETVGCRRCL